MLVFPELILCSGLRRTLWSGTGPDAVKNRRNSLTLLVEMIVPQTQEGSGLGFLVVPGSPFTSELGLEVLLALVFPGVGRLPGLSLAPASFLAFPSGPSVVISCRAFL